MENHFILTLGRSGSNTLVDALNQNPAVLNFGEVLGDWTLIRQMQRRSGLYRADDAAYLDALLKRRVVQRAANLVRSAGKIKRRKAQEMKSFRRIKTVGIKEFSLNMERSGLLGYLEAAPEIKVIGLVRRNPIDRMISSFRLQKTGIIKQAATPAPGEGVRAEGRGLTIEAGTILSRLETIEAETARLCAMLEALPSQRVYWIDYADFYFEPARTLEILRSAQAFIGVPPIVPAIRMTKIIQSDPLEILDNAAELRDVIAASRFAPYLYEAAG